MRWNNLGQPEPDRGRAGRCASSRPASTRPRRRARPVTIDAGRAPAARSARRRLGAPRRQASASATTAATAATATPAPAPAPAAAAAPRDGDDDITWAWPAAAPVVDAVRRGAQQGPGLSRQGGRPGARRCRRPRRLCRLGPARLRQPGHPQAQRDLPHGLRPQPDACWSRTTRPSSAARRSPRWARPTPTACSCTSRSASRASRSIRRACCRRASRRWPYRRTHVAVPVLAFDIETIPDVAGLRSFCAAPTPASSDAEVYAAEIADRAARNKSDFMPLVPAARARHLAACSATPRACGCTRSSTASATARARKAESSSRSSTGSTRTDRSSSAGTAAASTCRCCSYRGMRHGVVAGTLLGHGR